MKYAGKLAIQQRVLPTYRVEFFDLLAQQCQNGLSVFAGNPLLSEEIKTADKLNIAQYSKAINWHVGKPGQRLFLCWQWGLVRWLREWDPDVLIVEANPRYLSTRLAVSWMHKRKRAVIGWGLGKGEGDVNKKGWIEKERERFIRSLDGIISYSHKGALSYYQLGIPKERIFIAPNATSAKPNKPIPSRNYNLKKKTVLFVGRLQHRKKVDILIDACAKLPDELQPQLVIVGDGEARKYFEDIAYKKYPHTLFTGSCYGRQLEKWFEAAHLFVLPGTGGLAAQQALGYGLPIIVAEGDGSQEAFVNVHNGWQIAPNNIDSLHLALIEALSDPERLRKMGEESYRIASEEVNIEKMVESFLNAVTTIKPKS